MVVEVGEIKSSFDKGQIAKACKQLLSVLAIVDLIMKELYPDVTVIFTGKIFGRSRDVDLEIIHALIQSEVKKFVPFINVRNTTRFGIEIECI